MVLTTQLKNIIIEFSGEIIKCPICWNYKFKRDKDVVYLNCNHYYCKNCIEHYIRVETNRHFMNNEFYFIRCPYCRQIIVTLNTYRNFIYIESYY